MFAKRTNWNLETNRLGAALAAHRAAGKPLIDLTVSNPTECGFHYNEEAILAALRNPAALKYEPNPRGLAVAREAVARYYAERAAPMRYAERREAGGVPFTPHAERAAALQREAHGGATPHAAVVSIDDIFLTTSTSEAYSYVFRTLCDPDDEVVVPEPSYPLFGFLAEIQDVRLARYPLVYDHGWQIDFHSLEQAITPRTRGIIVVHPNNPTGNFCKPDEMGKLNEICAARGLAIIADEVFLDFALKENQAATFTANAVTFAANSPANSAALKDERAATFAGNPGALTFTLSGLSKICGLPQMKASWLAVSGPDALKGEALARLEVIADTYLSMNAPIQLALPAFLAERAQFQRELMARVKENLHELDSQLAEQKSCSRLVVEGGWNAVVRVPVIGSDEELALELVQGRGVYVHPGHFYDFACVGYLVVSLIAPTQTFSEGVRRLLSTL
jgi:aspartate/methionine/tyrosine aminotransferase